MNANAIQSLTRAVGMLSFVAQVAPALAVDKTPMPDQSGAISDRYADLVLKLEPAYLRLLDAAKAANPAKTSEAALTADEGKTAETAKTAEAPARIVPKPPTISETINPPHRKMAGM